MRVSTQGIIELIDAREIVVRRGRASDLPAAKPAREILDAVGEGIGGDVGHTSCGYGRRLPKVLLLLGQEVDCGVHGHLNVTLRVGSAEIRPRSPRGIKEDATVEHVVAKSALFLGATVPPIKVYVTVILWCFAIKVEIPHRSVAQTPGIDADPIYRRVDGLTQIVARLVERVIEAWPFEYLDGLQRSRRGARVAVECAREEGGAERIDGVHILPLSHECRDGIAVGHGLANDGHVRCYGFDLLHAS